MFKRKPATYDISPSCIPNILQNSTSPLTRIVELVPSGAKVLDVGAGSGLLARLFKAKNKTVVIDGIEPDAYASQQAKEYYNDFYCGLFQDHIEAILSKRYDYIVFADVIEHIPDPLPLLQRVAASISDESRVILSIPNVAFGAVRMALLTGNFSYVDSGLLEKTHVRFYTLQTIRELVGHINLHIEKLYYLQHDIFSTEIPSRDLKVPFACIRLILKDDLSSTYQFLLVLTKNKMPVEKLYFGTKTPLCRGFFVYAKRVIHNLLFHRHTSVSL